MIADGQPSLLRNFGTRILELYYDGDRLMDGKFGYRNLNLVKVVFLSRSLIIRMNLLSLLFLTSHLAKSRTLF